MLMRRRCRPSPRPVRTRLLLARDRQLDTAESNAWSALFPAAGCEIVDIVGTSTELFWTPQARDLGACIAARSRPWLAGTAHSTFNSSARACAQMLQGTHRQGPSVDIGQARVPLMTTDRRGHRHSPPAASRNRALAVSESSRRSWLARTIASCCALWRQAERQQKSDRRRSLHKVRRRKADSQVEDRASRLSR